MKSRAARPKTIACGRAGPVLPRPVLRETRAELAAAREQRAELAAARERAGVRVISRTRCSGGSDHQVLATPLHLVRQITLTLPSPGVPGEGSCRAFGIALASCGRQCPDGRFVAQVVRPSFSCYSQRTREVEVLGKMRDGHVPRSGARSTGSNVSMQRGLS